MSSLDNLQAWLVGKDVAIRIYRLSRQKPLKYHPDLADQVRRASTSIPANIAEGYGLGTRPQMVKGLRIAYGSALELRTHFEIAEGVPALPLNDGTAAIKRDIHRLIGLIVGLLKYYEAEPPP
ncbi:MAG: four helix bundle protein [Gemmatimonadales bacterium]